MVTKEQAKGACVDWTAVEKATEIKRTYLIKDNEGHEFFKMYKPSEAPHIFKAMGWSGEIVGVLNRSGH